MRLILLPLLLVTIATQAQWTLQESHTTASLRGIHALGNGIAWASGSEGTILHTTNNGALWQTCTIPTGAEHLDFRGIQAFDASTAIVMSSGKGDLSRLYKTTDACVTWKLVFTNPDSAGFWDAISFPESPRSPFSKMGYLIGDPVGGAFALFETADAGNTWHPWREAAKSITRCKRLQAGAKDGEALFAASNTALVEFFGYNLLFVTGGPVGARLMYADSTSRFGDNEGPCTTSFSGVDLPLARGAAATGAFSLAAQSRSSYFPFRLMVVGGDYTRPDATSGNSVFIKADEGGHRSRSLFTMSTPLTPPHGYRSSVAYSPTRKGWITVGSNGTDISTDDGRNWRALRPSATDAPDADQHWNALSLPFVVGPHGRIGILRPDALPATAPH